MTKDFNEKLASRNPNYEPRYWMRVWIVASSTMTGWRLLPGALVVAGESGKEFLHDLWHVLLRLVLPLTFFLAPLWLWMLEKDNARRARRQVAAAAAVASAHRTCNKTTETAEGK